MYVHVGIQVSRFPLVYIICDVTNHACGHPLLIISERKIKTYSMNVEAAFKYQLHTHRSTQ